MVLESPKLSTDSLRRRCFLTEVAVQITGVPELPLLLESVKCQGRQFY